MTVPWGFCQLRARPSLLQSKQGPLQGSETNDTLPWQSGMLVAEPQQQGGLHHLCFMY